MYLNKAESSRRKDRAELNADIRAGFAPVWMLKVILDRASSVIATLKNESSASRFVYLWNRHLLASGLSSDAKCLSQIRRRRGGGGRTTAFGATRMEIDVVQSISLGGSLRLMQFDYERSDSSGRSRRPREFDLKFLLLRTFTALADIRDSVARSVSSYYQRRPGGEPHSPTVISSALAWKKIEGLEVSLNEVKDVHRSMESLVADLIYCFLPISGQQHDRLMVNAMDIERDLDMLEYKLVQDHENIDMRAIDHLNYLLQSILPVQTRFQQHLASMKLKYCAGSVDKTGGSAKLGNITSSLNQSNSPSAEKQNSSRLKETSVRQLVEKGQDGIYLVPFLLSSTGSEDFLIPIQNAYNNCTVKGHFDVRIWVNVSGGSTMLSSKASVHSCINELINAHAMNSVDHLPHEHSKELESWGKGSGISAGGQEAHDQRMMDLERVIQCGLAGKKFLLVLHGILEDQIAQLEHLFRAIKSGREGSKIIVFTASTNVEESLRNVNILQSDEVENNIGDNNASRSCYVMNSAIHRLAEVVSASRFRRIECNYMPENPEFMTHMSIRSDSLPILRRFRWRITNLRTLIVFGPSEHTEPRSKEILDEFLEGQKYVIRALDLTGCDMKKLPELCDESRHHLRYLSLQDTSIETLEKFDKFYHLLVLNVQGCQLSRLPDYTSKKLLRLRHIIGPASLVSSIHGIGNLKNLQELEEFRVRKQPGYGIEELQHMNLRESLSITNLENVTIANNAAKVNLSLKTSLVSLKLEWHSTETSQLLSEEVLERLKPPESLSELEINGYPGINTPTWFTEDQLINMKIITLRNCFFVSVFAPLAKLPNLEVLTLERHSMLKTMSESDRTYSSTACHFPALVKLCIEDMPSLEDWTMQEPCFPCLEEFTVRNCPELTVLPRLHARVKKIRIEGVQLRSFDSPRMESAISSGESLDVSDRSPNRVEDRDMHRSKTFILRYCSNLSTFRIPEDDISSSSHCAGPLLQLELTECKELKAIEGALGIVEKLHIEKCHSSLKLPEGNVMQSLHTLHIDSVATHMDPFLLSLQALRVLIIEDSEELNSLDVLLESDHLPDTLEQLQLINCNSIKSLPQNMDRVLGLESLHLINCPNMESLTCLPNNLTELRISGCPILKEKYGDYGPEWDNISHVPYVSFD
ncbi:hypothetical protein OsI_36101 [Oryza sativa Indica Group]|uniref:R13L1/DRL21-like LRR repeat region domain-containing protein n=1 Tax=Oryza sativa subsp. indica TaxID=39946 RepID=B8BKH5_ORYSI|nr:hypothetical protein OsI_36101 [Oryza sativa Indica Group]